MTTQKLNAPLKITNAHKWAEMPTLGNTGVDNRVDRKRNAVNGFFLSLSRRRCGVDSAAKLVYNNIIVL